MQKQLVLLILLCVPFFWAPNPVVSATIDFGDDVFSENSAVDAFLLPWVEEGFAVYDLNSPSFSTSASIVKLGILGFEPRLRIRQEITIRVEQIGPPLGTDALGLFDLVSLDNEDSSVIGEAKIEVVTSKGGMVDISSEQTHMFTGPLFSGITFFDIVLDGIDEIRGDVASVFLDNIVLNSSSPPSPSPIPVPSAAWLFGTVLTGLIAFRKSTTAT